MGDTSGDQRSTPALGPEITAEINAALIGELDHGLAIDPNAPLGEERRLFAALYVRHRFSIVQQVRKFMHDQRDVDEVVQETFLRLFLALPEIESEAQAVAWSRRTATNLCIDRYRAAQRRPQLIDLELVEHQLAVDDEPSDPLVQAEDAAIVRHALSLLSPLHRAALIKREIEEKSLPQIAAELDIPEESVKHLLYRARRALRRALAGSGLEPFAHKGGVIVSAFLVMLTMTFGLPAAEMTRTAWESVVRLADRPGTTAAQRPARAGQAASPKRAPSSVVPHGPALTGTADTPRGVQPPAAAAAAAAAPTTPAAAQAQAPRASVPGRAGVARPAVTPARPARRVAQRIRRAAPSVRTPSAAGTAPGQQVRPEPVSIPVEPELPVSLPAAELAAQGASEGPFFASSPRFSLVTPYAVTNASVDQDRIVKSGGGDTTSYGRFVAPDEHVILEQSVSELADGSLRFDVRLVAGRAVFTQPLSTATTFDRAGNGTLRIRTVLTEAASTDAAGTTSGR
ncbi:MAG TPA: sigma-70 family RNA polymerase sigma factor, partial [Mycobacteriales bacterium]|nr:sigma-70 family RNA polymerase sigma factor [Mycobacteriales bacterium]